MGCAERRGSVLESQLQVHCSPRTPTIRFGNRHRISQERGRSAWNGDYACRGGAFLPRPARPPHLVPAQGAQPHTPGFPALEEVWRAAKARSGCSQAVLWKSCTVSQTRRTRLASGWRHQLTVGLCRDQHSLPPRKQLAQEASLKKGASQELPP